jgi:hypothetical protein
MDNTNEENDNHKDYIKEGSKIQTAMETDENSRNNRLAHGSTELSLQHLKQSQQMQLQQQNHATFQSLSDDNNNNPTTNKKKKKPVSKQVQNMLIKSKSTDNARVKQEDRLYFEIVIFNDDGLTAIKVPSTSSTTVYRFFSKQNDIQHDTAMTDNSTNIDLLQSIQNNVVVAMTSIDPEVVAEAWRSVDAARAEASLTKEAALHAIH